MAKVFSFPPALTVSIDDRVPRPVPAQFRETVDRHQKNLTALSAALRTAGMTPEQAAGYVDVALASFRQGLATAVAKIEDRDRANL